jgi:hypothetical protein
MFCEEYIFSRKWPKPLPARPDLPGSLWGRRCHGSTIVGLANGDLLAAWYEGSSDDNGKTWQSSGPILSSPPNIHPTVVELADGSLLCYQRYFASGLGHIAIGQGHIWQSTSRDRGQTWTPAAATGLKNPNSGIDLVRARSGNLALAFNDSYDKRTPLNVALSEDDGQTWPYQKIVESQPGSFAYPWLIQTADGLWRLTYSYNYQTIKHVVFDEDWLRSSV